MEGDRTEDHNDLVLCEGRQQEVVPFCGFHSVGVEGHNPHHDSDYGIHHVGLLLLRTLQGGLPAKAGFAVVCFGFLVHLLEMSA